MILPVVIPWVCITVFAAFSTGLATESCVAGRINISGVYDWKKVDPFVNFFFGKL